MIDPRSMPLDLPPIDIGIEPCEYAIGDIVEIRDTVDPAITDIGTIKFIEPDNDIHGLFWIYVIANEEVLNNKPDQRFGYYWEMLEHTSYRIRLLSRATV